MTILVLTVAFTVMATVVGTVNDLVEATAVITSYGTFCVGLYILADGIIRALPVRSNHMVYFLGIVLLV